ncbi:MAG: response regulator transcription factor [Bacteroidetes bacterium]|nr:response regulator transcription factor [Bacteroidota bacterium]MBS1924833.1 response regulator transcription factor [Bacteroidota bacterium]
MPHLKKIKCLIVDDEHPAREIMKQHISSVDTLELVGTCANAVEAVNLLKDHTVDLIFLDIQMPQILGTNFIRTLKSPPKIIFTTAFRKYAIEGFELDAVDYILKPISFERFLKAVNKVLEINFSDHQAPLPQVSNTNELVSSFLYFRVKKKMVKIFFTDILFIEALKDYIKIVTQIQTIVTKYVLSTLIELLPSEEFLRIHRSYIVAIGKIDNYSANSIQIQNYQLPIGRLYKLEVGKILSNLSAS